MRKSTEEEEQRIDELLESMWLSREEGKDTPLERRIIKRMEKEGLVKAEKKRVSFTPAGEARAASIIRRHRLAERLLSEVFELRGAQVEAHACKFEHMLSPKVTDSVCTFLGHPPTCPHGKAIPRGKCCAKFSTELRPFVSPLDSLMPGEKGRIVFITSKQHRLMDKLSSLGVVPGSIIKIHQKSPSYVIKIGETELAVDREVVNSIYVKRI
ncbi:MAG: metal-dependent transcriptional regulator [Candidatus Hydrothermarchaeaceae archaeon]